MRLPSIFSTLRFRIMLLFAAVFGFIHLFISLLLSTVYERQVRSDYDQILLNRARSVSRSITIDRFGQLEINTVLLAESGRLFPFQMGNEYIEVRNADGAALARSQNLSHESLPLPPPILQQLLAGNYAFETLTGSTGEHPFWGKGNLRLLSLPLLSEGRVQVLLQLGVSTHSIDASLEGLRTTLFILGLPLALFISGFGGWWLAGRAFEPVNRIISAAQRMTAGKLDERLPVPDAEDELKRLSVTLNEMFDRLEKAFHSQERFVADASHELKTPLTILLGELDVLQQQPRSREEYDAFLKSASEELRRLSQIVQNLLILARADSGRPVQIHQDIPLEEVILSVLQRVRIFAQEHAVKTNLQLDESVLAESDRSDCSVRGDFDLLSSLFYNLIHNAIKYSTAGQSVTVIIRRDVRGLTASIRDQGSGIRAEDLPHIFDRFHRAENPGRRQVQGTGLGLAIVKWIADAHGAILSVESKPAEGSTFTVCFPTRTVSPD